MEIKYLELFKDIICSFEEDKGDGILRICTATVSKQNTDPALSDCISSCSAENNAEAKIPAGKYFFAQGFLAPDINPFSADGVPELSLQKAAMDLWLEFLWQEKDPDGSVLYVRLLTKENEITDTATGQKKSAGTVFQLFRRIK